MRFYVQFIENVAIAPYLTIKGTSAIQFSTLQASFSLAYLIRRRLAQVLWTVLSPIWLIINILADWFYFIYYKRVSLYSFCFGRDFGFIIDKDPSTLRVNYEETLNYSNEKFTKPQKIVMKNNCEFRKSRKALLHLQLMLWYTFLFIKIWMLKFLSLSKEISRNLV